VAEYGETGEFSLGSEKCDLDLDGAAAWRDSWRGDTEGLRTSCGGGAAVRVLDGRRGWGGGENDGNDGGAEEREPRAWSRRRAGAGLDGCE
jgi:hypothetical protein